MCTDHEVVAIALLGIDPVKSGVRSLVKQIRKRSSRGRPMLAISLNLEDARLLVSSIIIRARELNLHNQSALLLEP